MNVLFFCQSKSLDVFYQLYLRMARRLDIGEAGFYVANIRQYEVFIKKQPDFEDRFTVVKEWEIYGLASFHTPDYERIASYEKQIGSKYLWGPLVTDRRLYMGRKSSFTQDYAPYFSFQRMLAVLDVGLMAIDKMFRQLEPDAVFTIYTATFGDCLGHMFAKSRGIKSYDFRLSRLKNYIMLVDGITEPPPHIKRLHDEFRDGIPGHLFGEAEAYVESVITKHAMYEGVKSGNCGSLPEKGRDVPVPVRLIQGLKKTGNFIKYGIQHRTAPYRHDMQISGYIAPAVYHRVIKPVRNKILKKKLAPHLIRKADLEKSDYVLYPLHTEPELVLSQFARPFLNQIEVIRNIRLSMPVGMKLFVKEHPLMFGRRSLGYYRKLLDIPGVYLMDFNLLSSDALSNTGLVVIIRGAIGLEAVMKRIPVVSIGRSMFDILPFHMFRVCHNMYELEEAMDAMLNSYRYDHEALIRYLAAVIKGSVAVNLITELLGKKGRYSEKLDNGFSSFETHPHLDLLADHIIERMARSRSGI